MCRASHPTFTICLLFKWSEPSCSIHKMGSYHLSCTMSGMLGGSHEIISVKGFRSEANIPALEQVTVWSLWLLQNLGVKVIG